MRRLEYIALAAIAWVAMADPAAADPVTGLFASMQTLFAAGGTAAFFGKLALRLVGVLVMSMLQKRKLRGRENPGMQGQFTTSGGIEPATAPLGWTAVRGHTVYKNAHGANNIYFNHVVELSDLPRVKLLRVVIDGEYSELGETPHADYGYPLLSKRDDEGRDYAWVRFHDGTQTAADTMLVAKYADHEELPWTEDHRLGGVPYAVLTYLGSREMFPTGEPSDLRFEMMGIPVYDVRKDSTAGGSGLQRLDDPATWEPSDNAIVLAWNIVHGIGLPNGAVWGAGADPEDIPNDWWIPAMNACDLDVGDGRKQYRAGLELIFTEQPREALLRLMAACNGEIVELGGTWYVHVGAPATPVVHLTDAEFLISEPDELTPFPGFEATYNGVTVTHPSPAQRWNARELPAILNEAWEEQDGGRRLFDLQLHAVPVAAQAQQIGNSLIRDERRFLRHSGTLVPEFFWMIPLMSFTWTSEWNGYEAKVFEIGEAAYDLRRLLPTFSVRERDPADFTPLPAYEIPDAPSSAPPAPIVDHGVPGFAVVPVPRTGDAGSPRPGLRVEWDSTEILFSVRAIEVEYQRSTGSDPVSQAVTTEVARDALLLEDLHPATEYRVRIRGTAEHRQTKWSAWEVVTTDDLRLTDADLADPLNTKIAAAFERHDAALDDATGTVAELRGRIEQALVSLDIEDLPATPAIARIDEEIADEIDARISATLDLSGTVRVERDRIRNHASEALEAQAIDADEREQIRQSLTVNLEDAKATFSNDILVLTDGQTTLAQRVVTLGAVTEDLEASVQIVDQARIDGDLALANQIALLSVGSAVQFDHAVIWYWDVAVEGWTGSPGAPSVTGDGWLAPASDSYIVSPSGLEVATSTYRQVRARLRNEPVTWSDAYLYWAGVGEGWDNARRVEITNPDWADDEAQLTVNADWSGTIDRVRFDLPNGVEIDWLAIGRPAPGASSAELAAEQQARIDGDSALASDITTLTADLTTVDGKADSNADALTALTVRVEGNEDGLVAVSQDLTTLTNTITDPETGLSAVGDAVDALEVETAQLADGISTASSSTRALRSAVRGQAGEALEGLAQDTQAQQANREIVATAAQELRTRIDQTDDALSVVSESVISLQAAIPGLATAEALQLLSSEVSQQGDVITSQGQAITSLESDLANAESGISGNTSAIHSLSTTVTQQGDTITSQGQAITALEGTVNDPVTGVAANAVAVSSLDTRVTSAEGEITSQGQAITALDNDLTTAEGNISGNATAISGLDTRVTSAEGTISSHGSAITDLESKVNDPETGVDANATAVSGLTTQVNSIDGDVTALAGRTDTLEAQVQDPQNGALARISDIEGAYVDANGAVAAVEQTISAEYGNMEALAEATAFAEVTLGGIASGFVWSLGQDDVLSLVLVEDGQTAPVTTARIKSDYIRLDGDVEVLGSFTISHGMALFEDTALQSDDFETGVSGWQISKDGDAEFNSLITRQSLVDGAVSDGGAEWQQLGTDLTDGNWTPVHTITLGLAPNGSMLFHLYATAETRAHSVWENNDNPGSSQVVGTRWRLVERRLVGGVWTAWDLIHAKPFNTGTWTRSTHSDVTAWYDCDDVEVQLEIQRDALPNPSEWTLVTGNPSQARRIGLTLLSVRK